MRRLRIVVGNVSADFTEVCNRRIGPDYFEVHAVAQESTSCSTFSWLLARPATISARPCRIDAMMCNSSVISSRDALSGSLSRASITACLSVMAKNEARVSLKGKTGMRFCLIFAACLTCVPRTRSSLALASHQSDIAFVSRITSNSPAPHDQTHPQSAAPPSETPPCLPLAGAPAKCWMPSQSSPCHLAQTELANGATKPAAT